MARRNRRNGGRGVRRHEFRRRLLLTGLVLAAAVLIARSFQLSVVQHGTWLRRAENQHADTLTVPGARGTIYDREGVPLAASREVWVVAIAPPEVADPELVIRKLSEHTGLTARAARRLVVSRKRWNVVPGRHEEAARAALDGIAGIHFDRTVLRFYPHERLGSEVLGRVNLVGDVAGGIEQELDSLLAGRDGRAVVRIDSKGRPIPGAMVRIVEPEAGRDVVLTLDAELQEIASDALIQALDSTGATSGEMVIADPYTGEILAAVSLGANGPARTWTAATSPYEPGSTIKPFTVASLLTERKAALGDSLWAEEGSYRLHGRTIRDVHGYGWLTLREGFLHSSNIVMAKAASRLSPAVQYQRLRDFGFGAATGITYPSESAGRLWRPSRWSKQSQASLAYGYEISVTPLQLVMAYGMLANGGVLLEPRLIREVRARDGSVLRRYEPRAVRRALPQGVARTMRALLAEAVESGTGQRASMGAWKVAGKTGTARFASGGRYLENQYVATFAGFFPAESPQLVFLVKLDRPRGDYYGGLTAAPVTRATLEAALAAHGTPLDRSAVATEAAADAIDERAAAPVAAAPNAAEAVFSVSLKSGTEAASAGRLAAESEPLVPDVTGLSLREAARILHEAGFHVRVDGSGTAVSTQPKAGERVGRGRTVRVVAGDAR
jgi:cell division protein FtsI (penicillin-binding protein 3)